MHTIPTLARSLILSEAPNLEKLPPDVRTCVTKVQADVCDSIGCDAQLYGCFRNFFFCEEHMKKVVVALPEGALVDNAFILGR